MIRNPFTRHRSRTPPIKARNTPATKYYRSGSISGESSPFESQKLKKQNPAARKVLFSVADIAVIVAILAILVYSLIVRPDPQISTSSTVYRPAAVYEQATIKQFQILKNRNKISLDEQEIVKDLQAQFPEIAGASVELPLFSETPIVHLNIALPSFFLTSNNTNYIVDSEGCVVARASSLPKIKNLTQVTDQSGFNIKLGQPAMSSANVAFIGALLAELKRAQVPVSSLTLPPLAQELDVRTADHGYYIKFFLGDDVLQETGQFLAARHNFATTNTQPSEYLDVRVLGKIYYK